MLYADERGGAALTAEQMAGFMGQMSAYQAALEKAGAFIATAALAPSSQAKTIGMADQLIVQDGPYADTREQLGGYFIIEATDMDEAVALAAECPAASWGKIEIRPYHQG
jgi:hypothetical protein